MVNTIGIRTKKGWKEVNNKEKYVCDMCGDRLWITPGGNLYCDRATHSGD